jgi:LysM repeat protein
VHACVAFVEPVDSLIGMENIMPFRRSLFGLILRLCAVAAIAGSIALVPISNVLLAQCLGTSYTVRPGDHLSSIARRHDVSIPQILQYNRIPNPNILFAGQTLCIPAPPVSGPVSKPMLLPLVEPPVPLAATPASVAPQPTPTPLLPEPNSHAVRCYEVGYTVQRGDSLYRIADRYGVLVQDVAARNGLPSTMISVGQLLIIPLPGSC